MQDPFKDTRYRQLFAGFMCAGLREALSEGKELSPRTIDSVLARWLAADDAGAAELMMKVAEAINAKLTQ